MTFKALESVLQSVTKLYFKADTVIFGNINLGINLILKTLKHICLLEFYLIVILKSYEDVYRGSEMALDLLNIMPKKI